MSEPQPEPGQQRYFQLALPETPAIRAAIDRLLATEIAACLAAVEPIWINNNFVGVQAIVGVALEADGTRYLPGQLIQFALPGINYDKDQA